MLSDDRIPRHGAMPARAYCLIRHAIIVGIGPRELPRGRASAPVISVELSQAEIDDQPIAIDEIDFEIGVAFVDRDRLRRA